MTTTVERQVEAVPARTVAPGRIEETETARTPASGFALALSLLWILLAALAITYVVAVVPLQLAFLLAVWTGAIGLLIAVPLAAVSLALGVMNLRRARRGERGVVRPKRVV